MKNLNKREMIKYGLLFLYFFIGLAVCYQNALMDTTYTYGFSYSIVRGELPYLDFNMIVPPFGAFLYAIPLMIFGNHYFSLLIFQAVLATIFFYYLSKLLNKKEYLLLILLNFVFPFTFFIVLSPNYNFLTLFELVLLIYLEKNECNDYLIGFLLGISFLTKQTVGVCFLLPSLYYFFKDYKKLLKRMGGFFIPVAITFLYLFAIGGFEYFIDDCFLGMFDFSGNSTIDWFFYAFIILAVLTIIRVIKDWKNLLNYYFLFFLIQAFPLFDYYHVTIVFFSYAIMLLLSIKKEMNKGLISVIIICISMPLISFLLVLGPSYKFRNIHHFEGILMTDYGYEEHNHVNHLIHNHDGDNIIIFSSCAYFYKIENDLDITRYDLINKGNNGYHSTEKIINQLKKEKDTYIFVNMREYNSTNMRLQLDKDVVKYVISNYQLVDELGNYRVYYKE